MRGRVVKEWRSSPLAKTQHLSREMRTSSAQPTMRVCRAWVSEAAWVSAAAVGTQRTPQAAQHVEDTCTPRSRGPPLPPGRGRGRGSRVGWGGVSGPGFLWLSIYTPTLRPTDPHDPDRPTDRPRPTDRDRSTHRPSIHPSSQPAAASRTDRQTATSQHNKQTQNLA